MDALAGVLIGTQLVFTVIAGLYFYTNLKAQHSSKSSIQTNTKKELEKMRKLRAISLTEPLSEKTRPEDLREVIGQEIGIKALRAAICGPNPQHVIIYGPPGIGKTAAARIILKNAAKTGLSPFAENAPFIEMDATILQFDERSIADPLIGSVHDPIYQGAGAYGQAGVPQPKPGAVTKAHGGVLFIDEIGELHHLQMNKLLKVLEDRKVNLSSSYYSRGDENIPKHIHDIFDNGLPADFRLIGATTRRPEEIPPALRSRCTEVFFRSLNATEISEIAANAFKKAGTVFEEEISDMISMYCTNGRDTVNIVQTAVSVAALDGRRKVTREDIEEVVEYGQYTANTNRRVCGKGKIGVANGLAISGSGNGSVLEIEALATPAVEKLKGSIMVTGIIEEEELSSATGKLRRKGTARASVDNVLTLIGRMSSCAVRSYDIHLNFPGGMPIDGPSAGIAIFTALYSAITEKEVSSRIAMTGEVSIKGKVNPVGGVASKLKAAAEVGIDTVYIPRANYQHSFERLGINVICVETVSELLQSVFGEHVKKEPVIHDASLRTGFLTAKEAGGVGQIRA